MSQPTKTAYDGKEVVGQVSAYAALPAVLCPQCGSKLHRIFNSSSHWKYICVDEQILVSPQGDLPPQKVSVG